MSCERHKKALRDAAAWGETLPSDAVRQHLESCEECQEFLAREQTLFASIDATLRRTANPELPHSFLARAGEHISRVPQANPYWRPAFGLAAVLLVVSFAVATHFRHGVPGNAGRVLQGPEIATQNVGHPDKRVPLKEYSRHLPGTQTQQNRIINHADSVSAQPEVLVPPDERQAFERFVADTQADQGFMMAFLTDAKEPFVWNKNPALQLQPLEVHRLEVTALEPQVETGNDPGNSR
jgi:hypothetical protein